MGSKGVSGSVAAIDNCLASGGVSGAIKAGTMGTKAATGIGLATLAGGFAGSYAGGKIAEATGGGRGVQHYASETGELGGSVGAGAAVGACFAGPVGAAAGAAMGGVGYG